MSRKHFQGQPLQRPCHQITSCACPEITFLRLPHMRRNTGNQCKQLFAVFTMPLLCTKTHLHQFSYKAGGRLASQKNATGTQRLSAAWGLPLSVLERANHGQKLSHGAHTRILGCTNTAAVLFALAHKDTFRRKGRA